MGKCWWCERYSGRILREDMAKRWGTDGKLPLFPSKKGHLHLVILYSGSCQLIVISIYIIFEIRNLETEIHVFYKI